MLGILLLILAGCTTPAVQATLPPLEGAQPPAVTPYLTEPPARTTSPTATHAPTPTLPPLPTPTPYLHTVVQGDTMIGIAVYFGISYDELSLANPEVNPNFLSVGTQLVIPLPEDDPGGEAQPEETVPEVQPLETGRVACYPLRTGGLWCYLPVANSLPSAAENIAGIVRLYNQQGEEVASQAAHSLLNLLPSGRSMPLAAFFAPPVPKWENAQGQLTSADAANQSESRYLPAEVLNLGSLPTSQDGLGVAVSGSLVFSLNEGEDGQLPTLGYAWVLVTAFDADGVIVGVRRWEAPADQIGPELNFDIPVFSLGKPIESFEVLIEARASQP